MTPMDPPPPVLCFARVLAYAIVDESVDFTGKPQVYLGGELLGRAPCLALCQNLPPDEDEIMLFHCDEQWNVLAPSGGEADLAAAKANVEMTYQGIAAKWIDTGISLEEARHWLEQQYPEDMCSFCGRLPSEFEGAFGGHKSKICNECVRKYFAMLQKDQSDDV
jgi:ClpX C4-type zinc finger